MRTDAEICQDVSEELRWTPAIDDKDIAVKVSDAVVTLTGFARSLAELNAAEKAAKRVAGVRALANDLLVHIPAPSMPSDPEIARNAVAALEHELPYQRRGRWN